MKFNNRPNFSVISKEDGKEFWISRSISVDMIMIIKNKNDKLHYVLMVKRGVGMTNHPHHWCLPCGYLDRDEHSSDAILREVFEETNINIPYLKKHHKVIESYLEQPFYVNSALDNPNQNVALVYGLYMEVDGFPATSTENCEPDEIAQINWFQVNYAIEDLTHVAFKHNHRIAEFYKALPTTPWKRFKKKLIKWINKL